MTRPQGDDGASAVEYGLLLAAMAAVIVVVLVALGGALQGMFKTSCDTIDTTLSTSSSCEV